MLLRTRLFALCSLALASSLSDAASVEVSMPTWPGGAAAAFTITLDDGHQAHASELAPLLAEFEVPATFYIVTDWVGSDGKASWDDWRSVQAMGHEIGNHSASHPRLPQVNDERLAREVVATYETITQELGQPPLTYAYPFCDHDERVRNLVFIFHLAARAYHPLVENTFNRQAVTQRLTDAIASNGWVVWLSHGLDPATLRAHLSEDLAPLRDQVWAATFAQVSGWQQLRGLAQWQVEALEDGSTRITAQLADGVQNAGVPLWLHLTGVERPPALLNNRDEIITLIEHPSDGWLLRLPAIDGASVTLTTR